MLELLASQLHEFVIVLADEYGIFTSWNPGVQAVFGYSADEFIGRPGDILYPLPDRLTGVPQRELQHAAEAGRSSDTSWLVTKSGAQILVEGVTVALRDNGGNLAGFGKVLRDVTERKNAEDNLKALARALDQSNVIVRDWDGTIEHWTAGCERLYGWTAQEAVGQICQEFLKSKFPAPLEEINRQMRETGVWKGELEHARRDGTRLSIAATWVLLQDDPDEPGMVIETQTDVSERSQMRRELEAANEQLQKIKGELERSNEELEEFARITSHDLSAPITSTRWLADLLASRHSAQLDEEGKRCVQQISQGLARMADLVEGILAHARVGRSPIRDSHRTEAEEALAIALENLRKDVETRGAIIQHDPLPIVQVELRAVSQLFQNLLSNALKYQRPNVPPSVQVSVVKQNEMWKFAVRDNGIGIEPEWLERVFQPMQRRHGLNVAGSGIGLATCRKIVTRAGGQIWVESVVGSGSTFFFTLPAVSEP
ncbi:MAG: PAS domain S-box protein [Acidobacteriaceae bacterium]|nr:PAS domain S-box protein [Acidobacteriaceae bacterium]